MTDSMIAGELEGRKVILHDMCLRDGMHAKREQISVDQMVTVATSLDDAGVPYVQVTHGAGLGGNLLQHGFAMASNEEYISAVASRMKQAKVSVLLIPGLSPWMNSSRLISQAPAAFMWRPTARRRIPHPSTLLAPVS